jgi:hypothetical protein
VQIPLGVWLIRACLEETVRTLIVPCVLTVLSMAQRFAGLMPRLLNDRDFVALPWNRGYYMNLVGSRRILFGRPVIQSRVRGYEVCITRSGFTTHLKNFPTALGIERESRIFRSIYGYRLVLYEFGHATKSIEFH